MDSNNDNKIVKIKEQKHQSYLRCKNKIKHCDICNKDVKYYSVFSHNLSKAHKLKFYENIEARNDINQITVIQ